MVCAFCTCWMPLNILHLALDLFGSELRLDRWPSFALVFFGAHLLAMSATLVHPVLYGAMNPGFRSHIALLCARSRALRALKRALLSQRCLLRTSPQSNNSNASGAHTPQRFSPRVSRQSVRPPLRDPRGVRTPPVAIEMTALAATTTGARHRRLTPAPIAFWSRVQRFTPTTTTHPAVAGSPAKPSPIAASAFGAAVDRVARESSAPETAVESLEVQAESFPITDTCEQRQQLTARRSHSVATTSAEVHPHAPQLQVLQSMPSSPGGTRTSSIPDIVVS